MLKLILSLIPLVGTSLGSYLGVTKHSKKIDDQEDLLVAVATGILGAICISLCFEAFGFIREISLLVGLMIGIVFIFIMNKITNKEATHQKLFWAMLIHNIPEGIIIGIALANSVTIQSLGIVASVSIQNVPDGLVVSLATIQEHGKRKSILLGIISGIVEPIATALVIIGMHRTNLMTIEPLFIGLSVSAILSIEWELLRECKSKKILIISLFLTLIFNGILG